MDAKLAEEHLKVIVENICTSKLEDINNFVIW